MAIFILWRFETYEIWCNLTNIYMTSFLCHIWLFVSLDFYQMWTLGYLGLVYLDIPEQLNSTIFIQANLNLI